MEHWKFTITAIALVLLLFIFIRPDKVDTERSRESADQPEQGSSTISALDSQIQSKSYSDNSYESDGIVTGTWGALRNQAPIQLPGGGTARLGLEASSAPGSSGILIYCLVDDSNLESRRGTTELQLGPLDIQIHRPGLQEALEKELVSSVSAMHEDGEQLYVQTIPINGAGRYRIEVSLHDDESDQSKTVAEFTVTGRSDSFHSWFPFGFPSKPEQLDEVDSPKGVSRANLAVSDLERGAAVPSYDGMMPIAYSDNTSPRAVDDAMSLPKLFPEAVDPGLQLQATGTGFSLESERPFMVEDPGSHLLARWWVNGEPYSPHPQKERSERAVEMREHTGQFLESDTHRFEVSLEFDPSTIGAQAGDRIGFQLLYLSDGWKHVRDSDPTDVRSLQALDEEEPPVPRLSNHIEFPAK